MAPVTSFVRKRFPTYLLLQKWLLKLITKEVIVVDEKTTLFATREDLLISQVEKKLIRSLRQHELTQSAY